MLIENLLIEKKKKKENICAKEWLPITFYIKFLKKYHKNYSFKACYD